jgi:isoleucyl-tRNA synthetase
MLGYRVPPRAGLDCHGLGVEVAVARELGLSGPREIEAYGVGPFLARCRESALRHGSVRYAVADRLGWLSAPCDPASGLRTTDARFTEAAWAALKRLFDVGLLVRETRAGPYCPRCQERLAGYELRGPGVYRPVRGLALVARFPLIKLPEGANRYLRDAGLLVWTPAPWTLAASSSVTVDADETYAVARRAGEDARVVIAESRLYRVLGDGWHVVARMSGRDLAGASCLLPFPRGGAGAGTACVIAAEAGGARLVEPDLIGPDGRFCCDVPRLRGVFFADADLVIASYLADRGLLFSSEPWESRRPHCWRCGSRLLTRTMRSWYLLTGSWPDWALSRAGFWGTPMPFLECADGHVTWAGSLSDLRLTDARCSSCSRPARWIAETVDAGFDAGLMPFLQYGGRPGIELGAGEAGFHYAAGVLGRLLYGQEPARGAGWRGHVVDAHGRRMSRAAGNLTDPLTIVERHGADAVRWYFASLTPRQARSGVPDIALASIRRRVLHRYLKIVSLQAAPGRAGAGTDAGALAVLDRWLLSESQEVVREVTAGLEAFRCDRSVRRLEAFIRDLSCWYVPLSGSGAASPALGSCLDVLTRLMAPFAPFLTDHAWQLLRGTGAGPDSVHLASWPEVRPELVDPRLLRQMTLTRRLVRSGRAARAALAAAGLPARRPLPRAWISAAAYADLTPDLLCLMGAEINVGRVEPGPATGSSVLLDLGEH